MMRRPMVNRLSGLLCGVAIGAVAPLAAQDHVAVTARFAPAAAKPGDDVVLEVVVEVEAGWHVYGGRDPVEPTRLTVESVPGLELLGAPEIPSGVPHTAYGATNYWIEGRATLKQRFRVLPEAPASVEVAATVHYMACTPEFCDPPGQARAAAKLEVTGGGAAAGPAAQAPPGGAGGAPAAGAPQDGDPDARVAVAARFQPASARPGDEVVLEVTCDIEPGWHIYGAGDPTLPTRLEVTAAPGLEPLGEPEIPAGEPHESFGTVNFWIEPRAVLKQRYRVTDPARTPVTVRGAVHYMACTPEFCDRPTASPFTAQLAVPGAPAAPPDEGTGGETPADGGGRGSVPPGNGTGDAPGNGTGTGARTPDPGAGPPGVRQPLFELEGAGEEGGGSLWALILLCIGGGLIALVMPCTYPMIPITFSFFTKQAEARHGNVLPLALTYGGGIVLMFVLIGLLVGPVIIEFAAHEITNLVIGAAFLLFAFVLFGWIDLQMPAFVSRVAGKASHTGGLLGVFLMGGTLVVTSFTCTAPIVGSLLASVAHGSASQLDVSIGMATFGLTMAAPFVFLALVPGRVRALPRSGEWMHTLKVSLGFVELAAALKFLSNADVVLHWQILPREVFLFAWALVFALLALFLFGLFRGRGEPVTGVSKTRNGFGIASLAFACYCVAGASGLRLDFVMTAFEPPYQLRAVEEHTIVKDDHLAAMEIAQRENKYVLVNFTGFT